MSPEKPIHNNDEKVELSPESLTPFPIVESKELLCFQSDRPELQEDVITHWRWRSLGVQKELNSFALQHTIDRFDYVVTLKESFYEEGEYSLQSEAKGYGFALMDLDEEAREELFKIRASFIESLTDYAPVHIETIHTTHASVSYSAQDIDDCTERILSHPENTYSKEGLAMLSNEYKGHQIFEIYNRLFGEYFHGEAPNVNERRKARSRLFKSKFKKYLKRWEVVEDADSSDFFLRRKA